MPRTTERGTALALVLWGLIIGGALFTVTVVLAVEEQRAIGAARSEEEAFVAAEAGGTAALSGMTVGALQLRLPRPLDSLPLAGGPGWTALLRRLTPGVLLLEVSGGAAARERDRATVRLGWLMRPAPESLPLSAAASVGGGAFLGDDVLVSGRDEPPPGHSACAPADSAIPGIAAAAVSMSGSAAVSGRPPVVVRAAADSGLAPRDLAVFRRLAARATRVLSSGAYSTNPATVGASCATSEVTNWGDPRDPAGPCGSYQPIISVAGGLTLTGGTGQGILLVDGDLHVQSSYEFDGIVIVTGTIIADSQFVVRGAIATAFLGSNTGHLTKVEVRYSSCIIANVLENSAPLQGLPSRAWKQLFRAS